MRLKVESARRQLGTALALYLDDYDPVSVHCLAGGACEVIDFYVRKAGKEPFVTHILHNNPHRDLSGVRRLQRQYWTAFKHATKKAGKNEKIERDDEALLADFSDEQNDEALLVGWTDYARATQTMPIEAQVHQVWYFAKNPSKLNPKHLPDHFERQFPRLNSQPRSEQKARLREKIEWARSDPELMNDPKTDARPLILPWDS
jgi:hypothetical protein